jgi:serine/threonine protein kinase
MHERKSDLEARFERLFELVSGLLSGKVFEGRYSLDSLVRSDPFGVLYDAVDLERRAPVMVRVGRTQTEHPPALLPLPRMAPHAVELIEVGVASMGGLPYAVLEPLTGEFLSDRLERGNSVCWSEALEWCRRIAETLEVTHANGDVHGWVCPASIFLQRANTVEQELKVLNFELKGLGGVRILGAPALQLCPFRAPEVASSGSASRAADVFAFAGLVATLFAGTMPPAGVSVHELRAWAQISVPALLRQSVALALSTEPGARPPVSDLRALLGGLSRV